MVFELIAVAKFQTIYFDYLGRIGDVWSVYELLGAQKGLLLCHLGAALCHFSFELNYTGFGTLSILELLSKSAIMLDLLGILACCLLEFSKLD